MSVSVQQPPHALDGQQAWSRDRVRTRSEGLEAASPSSCLPLSPVHSAGEAGSPAGSPIKTQRHLTATALTPSSSSSSSSAAAAAAAAAPADSYFLERVLSDTLFGRLYLARQLASPNNYVVMKISQRKLLAQGVSCNGVHVLENTHHEAAIMRRLQRNGGHTNVLRLLGEHTTDHHHILALEWAKHGDLYERLIAHGAFAEDVARVAVFDILQGLCHIHCQGVAHLDLSLENILVARRGVLKIADFGCARRIPQEVDEHGHVTRKPFPASAHARPGKIRYMAPEVYQGQAFDGQLADMFSLGVIAFQLFVCGAPFELPSDSDPRFKLIMQGKLGSVLQTLQLRHLFSGSAIDFLSRVLAPAERRMSSEEALAHAWFVGMKPSARSS